MNNIFTTASFVLRSRHFFHFSCIPKSLLNSQCTAISRVNLQPASFRQLSSSPFLRATLNQVIRGCRKAFFVKPKSPALDGNPQRRGVVLKLFAVKPKKPNSAQRACCRVRLSNQKVVKAYIPVFPSLSDFCLKVPVNLVALHYSR